MIGKVEESMPVDSKRINKMIFPKQLYKVNKDRIHWLDVAKGIMIVTMVLNHVPNYAAKQGNCMDCFPWWLVGNFFGVYTMQAFFVLTGYCSSFSGSFVNFIIKQTKSLLVPYFAFTVLSTLLGVCLFNENYHVVIGEESYFFLIEGYWFLAALFLGKLLIYIMLKFLKKEPYMWIAVIFVMLVGFWITSLHIDKPEPSHYHNWFHYRNALCMTPFIYLGIWLRTHYISSSCIIKCSCIYVFMYSVTLILNLFDYNVTYIAPVSYTHNLILTKNVNVIGLVPSYLFYCTLGTILTIGVSKFINTNSVLEQIGKFSLTIYCVHFTVLQLIIMWISSYISCNNVVPAAIFFMLVSFLTLLFSIGLSCLFSKKPLSYLLGKF